MRPYVTYAAGASQISGFAMISLLGSYMHKQTMGLPTSEINIHVCYISAIIGLGFLAFGWYILYKYHKKDLLRGRLGL